MTRKYEIYTPGVRMVFKKKEIYDTVNDVLKNDLYPVIIYTLMCKLHQDPDILNLRESSTDVKLSQTIKGVESLAVFLESMQEDQGKLREQLNESIMLIKAMADKLSAVEEHNTKQQNAIKDVLDILSSSSEGLNLLKEITDKTQTDLSSLVKESTEDVANPFNSLELTERVNNLESTQDSLGNFGNLVVEGMDDEDDLFGTDMDEGSIAEIVRNFKAR